MVLTTWTAGELLALGEAAGFALEEAAGAGLLGAVLLAAGADAVGAVPVAVSSVLFEPLTKSV